MSAVAAIVLRELRRGGAAAGLPITFFLVVATLFAFAVGPDAALLRRIAPGALWVAALLAALLPVDRLVDPDRAGGVLDQLAARGIADETIAAAKLAGHWLAFAPALLVATAPAGLLLGLNMPALGRLELALLLGTPGLAALALGVAALTSGLGTAGALGGLLALPLAVPVLIFGSAAAGGESGGALRLLAAASLLLVAGCPFAAGAALRAARD